MVYPKPYSIYLRGTIISSSLTSAQEKEGPWSEEVGLDD